MKKILGVLALLIFTSSVVKAQAPWAPILSSSRAIDWGNAGLPATFPDGETTSNPWTPPTRSTLCTSAQAGTTLPLVSTSTPAQIKTAAQNCSAANTSGSVLMLASGTFTINANLFLNGA